MCGFGIRLSLSTQSLPSVACVAGQSEKTLVESSSGVRKFWNGLLENADYGFLASLGWPAGAATLAGLGHSSFIGCEKIKRFDDGSSGGLGSGTSAQRRKCCRFFTSSAGASRTR
jgi:hypothetical protein